MFFDRTRNQVSNEEIMDSGSKSTDGGNLSLTEQEYIELLENEPLAKKYIRPYLGGTEFLNGIKRWCLWFHDTDALELNNYLKEMPRVRERLEKVREMRLLSTDKKTKEDAVKPHLFQYNRQPNTDYIFIPQVSSENRRLYPIGFISKEVVCTAPHFRLPNATLYHFGVLSSSMHNAFIRLTAGRLKSDYRYSNSIVYNNFQFPFDAKNEDGNTVKAKDTIAEAAQAVLDARQHYQDGSEDAPTLAQLYNTYMIDPYPELTKAHTALDKAVDKAYGYKGKGDDASRVEFLLKKIADV